MRYLFYIGVLSWIVLFLAITLLCIPGDLSFRSDWINGVNMLLCIGFVWITSNAIILYYDVKHLKKIKRERDIWSLFTNPIYYLGLFRKVFFKQ